MSLVKIENIVKDYLLPKKNFFGKPPVFRALDGINLEIKEGESFGIVGESGCGKSTLARIVMALEKPTSGTVYYNNVDLFSARSRSSFSIVLGRMFSVEAARVEKDLVSILESMKKVPIGVNPGTGNFAVQQL